MKQAARLTFRRIELSGTAHQRGLAHGEQMRSEIAETLVYYKTLFRLSDDIILERAAHFKNIIMLLFSCL